jgi:hypothetical protein
MIEWRRVPWSIWTFVLASIGLSAWFVTRVSRPALALLLFVAIVLAWAVALLSGMRWLWIATVVVGTVGLIDRLATGPRTWYGIAGEVIGLGLLLLPSTRRYFADQRPAAEDSEGEVASP